MDNAFGAWAVAAVVLAGGGVMILLVRHWTGASVAEILFKWDPREARKSSSRTAQLIERDEGSQSGLEPALIRARRHSEVLAKAAKSFEMARRLAASKEAFSSFTPPTRAIEIGEHKLASLSNVYNAHRLKGLERRHYHSKQARHATLASIDGRPDQQQSSRNGVMSH
jgi:hypothetical protein